LDVPARTFPDVWEAAEQVPGWLTRGQAELLWQEAARLPRGSVALEVGSHHGRSTVVLASALAPECRLVAVDPFPPDWKYGARGTEERLRSNLDRLGVAARVDGRVATSQEVRASWQGTLGLVYVDGKHDYWSVRHDLTWARAVEPGGRVLVHDAFSSIGVTLGLLAHLLPGRGLRYLGRTGSLAVLEVGRPSAADRLRLLRPLPWWVRNVAVKVLLRLRLRGVAAAVFGHRDGADPY